MARAWGWLPSETTDVVLTTYRHESVEVGVVKPGLVRITSTSGSTAQVTQVVLREGPRTRLVFTPTLVDNGKDPEASVRGELAYQSKNAADE